MAEVWTQHGAGHSGMFPIGHSIGAAITATIASAPHGLPVTDIALSGIGVRTPAEHGPQWNLLPQTEHVEMPQVGRD